MTARIRMVSDGRVQGTKVLMPDGRLLPNVRSVEILPIAAGGDVVQARVTFACVELDVTADVVGGVAITPADRGVTTTAVAPNAA